MNARIYDPELARFMSADPTIPDPFASQSFNRYSYVNNNPLSFTDPTGLQEIPTGDVMVVTASRRGHDYAGLDTGYYDPIWRMARGATGQLGVPEQGGISGILSFYNGVSVQTAVASGGPSPKATKPGVIKNSAATKGGESDAVPTSDLASNGAVTDTIAYAYLLTNTLQCAGMVCFQDTNRAAAIARMSPAERRAAADSLLKEQGHSLASLLPVLGDSIAIKEAVDNPGWATIIGAAISLVPVVGDAGRLVLREAAGVARSATGVGMHAGESIAARSQARDFTATERARINEIGAKTGCHTCGTTNPGTKSGNFVPDHQPPSALNPLGEPQRLYPQCLNCSREQGLEIARQLQQSGR